MKTYLQLQIDRDKEDASKRWKCYEIIHSRL